MMVALKSVALKCNYALPALLVCITGLVACGDSGNSNSAGHSDIYYHSVGFHDPYYYGDYDYGYETIIVPPSNGNKPDKPNRPGNGERPGNGLKPSHPIANPPGIGNRPERPGAKPMPSHRKPSIPSRARPSSMGRNGMMRGGGGMRGGMRGGGGRRR